jgi:serine acetyltransferase
LKYWNKEFNWITGFMKGYLRKCYEVEIVIGANIGKVLELLTSDVTRTIHNL